MKRLDRIYRGKEWADEESNRPAHRLAVGLGLLLAAALLVLTVLLLLGGAAPG